MDELSIFQQALEKASDEERSAWLDEVCGSDAPLRKRIDILLASHEQAGSFLEQPAAEFEATIIHSAMGEDRAQSLQAGLAAAFGGEQAVVLGDGNHSVLKMLGETLDRVPRVALRDPVEEGADPIVRPKSAEMPMGNSDSRYQLQGEIARGGMGAILKGRDTDLGRDLAIKVLLDQHKDKPEVVQRFIEEAQIGGQLQHPGIAPIYELGQFADKRPFFAMKLVKGETLSKLLANREELTAERGKFIGIFEQICQTMAYAHSRGVIHRDLKPANIMVGAFGEVQVMDWGLAKVMQVGGVADEKKSHTLKQGQSIIQTLRSQGGSDVLPKFGSAGSHTLMGSVMGTPAYMPPEQALGEVDRLDERSDVFGLGAILCVILTGQPPYVGADGTAVFRQASRGKLQDAFNRLDGCGADPDLIALAKHCLELEPTDRPRDAGVLAARVTEYLESVEARLRDAEVERAAHSARADAEAAQAAAERRRAEAESLRAEAESARASEENKRRRTSLALAAAVLLLVGVGSGGWLYMERQEANRQTAEANAQRKHAGEMQTLADERDGQRKLASRQRDAAQLAEQATAELAAKAERERDIAQRESYRSKIKLAESMLKGDEQARYRVADLLWEAQSELRGWEWGYTMARCPLEEWSLQTKQGGLVTLAASADGRFLATGGSNGTVALWDSWTRQEVWRKETGSVHQISVDPQGRFVALGYPRGAEPHFRVLDLRNGNLVVEGSGAETQVVFSADGNALYVYEYRRLHRYDTTNWKSLASVPVKLPRHHLVKLFADVAGAVVGLQLDFVAQDEISTLPRNYLFFDATTLQSASELDALNVAATTVHLHAAPVLDSRRGLLASTMGDGRVWQHTHSESAHVIGALPGRVDYLVHDAGADTIVAASDEGSVLIVNSEGRTRTLSHGTSIRGMVNLNDGRFVTGGADGLLKCWTLRERADLAFNHRASERSTGAFVEFIDNGQRLLMKTWEADFFQLVDMNSLRLEPSTRVLGKMASSIRPRTNEVMVADDNGLSFFAPNSVDKGAAATRLVPIGGLSHQFEFGAGAPRFDESGRVMAVKREHKDVIVFDLAANQPLPAPQLQNLHEGDFWITISPSGRKGAAHSNRGLQVWEVSTGRLLKQFDSCRAPHLDWIEAHLEPAFHPGDDLLAVIDAEKGIVIWDTALDRLQQEIPGIAGVAFWRCQFSPDGNRLLVAGSDSKIRVFDWRLGRELIALSETTMSSQHCPLAASPDGRVIAYGGHNPSLRIAKALPWKSGGGPDAAYYRAVDELRIYSSQVAKSSDANADRAELLGDVHRRRGETAEAIAHYDQAIQELQPGKNFRPELQQPLVDDKPYGLESLGRLAHLREKRYSVGEAGGHKEREAWLQQSVDFWQTLAAAEKSPAIVQSAVLRFQLKLADLRLARDPQTGDTHLQDFIDFWDHLSVQNPGNRFCAHALSVLTHRLIADHIRSGDLQSIQARADSQPVFAVTMGDRLAANAKFEQAISFYSKAITPETTDGTFFKKRAAAYRAMEQWELATADLSRALQYAPESSQAGLVTQLTELLLAMAEQKSAWTVLTPSEMKSEGGATLTKLEDNSILASGKLAESELYKVTARSSLPQIAAIRLEALTDPSRPNNGPGRSNNGDFVMDNFRVSGVFGGAPDSTIEITLDAACSDVDNPPRPIRPGGEWHTVIPGGSGGKPHVAVYRLQEGAAPANLMNLNFELKFNHGPRFPTLKLGRFRLSVSDDPNAYANAERRFAALKLTDPWKKLAVAYHLVGDQQALAKLLEKHPEAKSVILDLPAKP